MGSQPLTGAFEVQRNYGKEDGWIDALHHVLLHPKPLNSKLPAPSWTTGRLYTFRLSIISIPRPFATSPLWSTRAASQIIYRQNIHAAFLSSSSPHNRISPRKRSSPSPYKTAMLIQQQLSATLLTPVRPYMNPEPPWDNSHRALHLTSASWSAVQQQNTVVLTSPWPLVGWCLDGAIDPTRPIYLPAEPKTSIAATMVDQHLNPSSWQFQKISPCCSKTHSDENGEELSFIYPAQKV